MVNLKKNQYQNTLADLIILDTGRISKKLLEGIDIHNIFRRIIVVDLSFSEIWRRKTQGYPDIIRKACTLLTISLDYPKIYLKYRWILGKEEYNGIVLSALWNYGRYVIYLALRKKINVDIFFVEEGTSNYFKSLEMCRYLTKPPHVCEKLLWSLITRENMDMFDKMILALVRGIYLYCPENYQPKATVPILELSPINDDSDEQIMAICKYSLSTDIVNKYIHSELFYFLQNQPQDKIQSDVFIQYIQSIANQTKNKIIVKVHPHYIYESSKLLNSISHTQNMSFDYDSYLLEGLYANINLNEKILVTRDSSSVIYPKYMFGYEPTIVFTYKLYNEYYLNNKSNLDTLVQNLINVYSDRAKIHVPDTIETLQDILNKHKF